MIEKIISGGQTGVDRAALDVALKLGIPCGGWCPKGRRAEDGVIPERYPLIEIHSRQYPARTRKNVKESDATLILTRGFADRGTALTVRLAQELQKPNWLVDLDGPFDFSRLRGALDSDGIAVLNVAGPRESSNAGIYEQAFAFLSDLLSKDEV